MFLYWYGSSHLNCSPQVNFFFLATYFIFISLLPSTHFSVGALFIWNHATRALFYAFFFPCGRKKGGHLKRLASGFSEVFCRRFVRKCNHAILAYLWWPWVDHRHRNLRIEKPKGIWDARKKQGCFKVIQTGTMSIISLLYALCPTLSNSLIWGAVQPLIGLWSSISYFMIYKLALKYLGPWENHMEIELLNKPAYNYHSGVRFCELNAFASLIDSMY